MSPSETSPKPENHSEAELEASFSTLILSIASTAAMALGAVPNPANGRVEKDRRMARFNIELLRMLREKTKGNLSSDEQRFIDSVVSDLQLKFVAMD
jgi:hypothetical protein